MKQDVEGRLRVTVVGSDSDERLGDFTVEVVVIAKSAVVAQISIGAGMTVLHSILVVAPRCAGTGLMFRVHDMHHSALLVWSVHGVDESNLNSSGILITVVPSDELSSALSKHESLLLGVAGCAFDPEIWHDLHGRAGSEQKLPMQYQK